MVRCLPHVLQRNEASAVGEEVPETGWHCLLHLGLREVAISLHLNMLTSWDEHRHQGTGWHLLLPKEFRQGLSSRQRVCDREQPVLSKNLMGCTIVFLPTTPFIFINAIDKHRLQRMSDPVRQRSVTFASEGR